MAGTSPELPQDILMVIFATLEIPDLVRAGSVCSSWHSAYRRLRKHYKRAQTPCLIYTSKSGGENVACLYSLAENRVYKLTLPEPPISTRYLIGSSLGLLVTVDNRSEMHLVNPITREQIDLPSVSTIEQLSFARTGDDSWTWLPPYMHYHDCIYKDGLLCAATRLGEIHGFNLSSTMVTMKIIMEGPQPDRGPSVKNPLAHCGCDARHPSLLLSYLRLGAPARGRAEPVKLLGYEVVPHADVVQPLQEEL
ncbi:F-box protein At5g25290-like [Lolium perenne]|uniref:F-box protein At5g25290-like n=1 Tax=Lolium perenne TaxID=4522 RepID=UPI0021F67F0B|nr:F-box protein At5g25290-like [Lolium perenne]